MKAKTIFAGLVGAFAIVGCTSTEKVSVVQPGDRDMTCEQLESEFAQLDQVMREAEGNKGVNTANVAAAVFFWPAAVGNYMDADKAEKLVEDRRQHLMSIHQDKGC